MKTHIFVDQNLRTGPYIAGQRFLTFDSACGWTGRLAVDATLGEIGQAILQIYCVRSVACRNSNTMTPFPKHTGNT